ncbi:hypothetical protein SLS53_009171 [Cytospora paraplurivora]|uniref:Uncharacterized protein n=1 Tax=Cytospora paraplurivora TaxID=2898453 RepID=A0AAN9TYP6_9PEZI
MTRALLLTRINRVISTAIRDAIHEAAEHDLERPRLNSITLPQRWAQWNPKLIDGEAPQAEQPPLKRIRVADREETHLWTTVKQYIENPKDFPEPQSPDPYKLLDDSKQKVGIVLPYLRFPDCIHLIPGKRLPIATSEDANMVPLTKPELEAAGAYFPGVCLQCGVSHVEQYLDISFDFIAKYFHGTQQGSAEVIDPEWHKTIQAAIKVARNYMVSTAKETTWQVENPSDVLLEVVFVDHYGMRVNESINDVRDTIVYVGQLGDRKAVWSVPRRAVGLI